MSELEAGYLDTKFMVDPYTNWVKAEGVPIITGQAIDLLAADVRHWARFGMKGAVCHVDGGGDFLTAFLFEIPATGRSAPVRHVYEEICYVLAGQGETEITLSNGEVVNVEWRERQLFTVPVNATARHRATGGSAARFVAVGDLRYLMGLYRNEAFLFANSSPMHERQRRALQAGLVIEPSLESAGPGDLSPIKIGDLSVGVDMTVVQKDSQTLARRQMQGRHILGLDGQGFTLSFASEASDVTRIGWRHGIIAGLSGMRFHQHFAAGHQDARLLSFELGSLSSPMFRSRRFVFGDNDVYASGAAVIPRDQERPDLRNMAAGLQAGP